jgi:hypothetical protein
MKYQLFLDLKENKLLDIPATRDNRHTPLIGFDNNKHLF